MRNKKKPTQILRMKRMERLARREKGVPYGQEIEQIYSKSFKFVRFGAICVISREATPFNPMKRGMSLYKQVPTERLSGFGGFLKNPRDFKSVESVKSVRNKKAHTESTDDMDGTPCEA